MPTTLVGLYLFAFLTALLFAAMCGTARGNMRSVYIVHEANGHMWT